MRIFSLIHTISRIQKNLSVQHTFLQKNIAPILFSAQQNNDGSLDEVDFKKINQYYGLAVPAILAESFSLLHGRALSEAERWTSTCQGAMTGLFDDFFDKSFIDDDLILNKTLRSSDHMSKKQNEVLFEIFYDRALQHIHDRNEMIAALKEVYDAQIKSKKQTLALPASEISDITDRKGGASLLFYRTSLNEKLDAAEKTMLYQAGALMQLCNDIFDIYKDRESKISTLATTCKNVQELSGEFHQQLEKLKSKIAALPFPRENKQRFFEMINLAVFSRTEVCLKQLADAEQEHGQFSIENFSRQELICDMDTVKNKLRSAYYFLKH